jgi:hypothetical protein
MLVKDLDDLDTFTIKEAILLYFQLSISTKVQ